MKLFAALILALIAAAAAARADTKPLVLVSGGCGTNTYGTCNVYKDAAIELDLYWNFDGVLWLTKYNVRADGTRSMADQFHGNAGGDPRNGFSGVALVNGSGQFAVASGDFATRRTCVGSGRGQHCTTYVIFSGGTATLP